MPRAWQIGLICCPTLLSLTLARSGAGQQQAPAQSEAQVLRLRPSAFKKVPAQVLRKLEAQGCTIPQDTFSATERTNLIHGEFARRGQSDWAALCSRHGVSIIEVFWGGISPCPSRLWPSEEAWIQGNGRGTFEFSRLIRAVNGADIAHYASPPAPGSMDHQGLEDAFAGKVSSVYYCNAGKWTQIASAD